MKPKILFVADSAPFPPTDGKRQRSLALVKGASIDYQVDYLILGNKEEYQLALSHTQDQIKFFYLPQNPSGKFYKKLGVGFRPHSSNQKVIHGFLEEKDYAVVLCRYAIAAKDLPDHPHLIIDVDDDYLELMQRKILETNNWFKKVRYWQILKLNSFYYYRLLRRAACLILVKEQKLHFPHHILPNLPFQILLKGEKRVFVDPAKNSLLFVGKLSYAPNAEGIYWFLENVWKELQVRNPNARLTIISSVAPDPKLGKLIRESLEVELLVNVEEIGEVYRTHALAIVPIFSGGGSNVKLAEAIYYYRKVISTPFGARGFEAWASDGLIQISNSRCEWMDAIESSLKAPVREEMFGVTDTYFSLDCWNQTLKKILNEA